jgi:NAD-dependent deacetylase
MQNANNELLEHAKLAAETIRASAHCTGFTGAGISVESGIPPFRGENGLWSKYDPSVLDLSYFHRNPEESWRVIKEIFYSFFGKAEPNEAHTLLAEMEKQNLLKALITQNIDNLHHKAGSRDVIEYHGSSRRLVCTACGTSVEPTEEILSEKLPHCECGGIYKPDFIFFGESIPAEALSRSQREAQQSDCMILIGTTGEVYPAALVPQMASQNGATIIEINPSPSLYTNKITDIFLRAKAVEAAKALRKKLFT